MHWEAADKKLKQLQADHKRCKSSLSDFPSANDILLQQGHVAEIEKAKYSKRLEEAEGKLQTAVHDLFAKLRSAKTEESTKSQSSGALGNHTNGSAESQSSFTKTIVDETSVLKKTMQTEFDTKTAELGAQLRLERDKNEQLQKRLEALEQRMDVQEKESRSGIRQAPKQVDNQPAGTVSGQQEDIEMPEVEDAGVEENISEPTVEADSFISRKQLDDILREFDERISCCESTIDRSQEQQSGETPPGEQMAQKLRSMISTLRSLELSVGQEDIVEISKGMQELSRRVDSHTGAMEELSKAHAENASVIKAIKPSSTGQPADQPAMNTAKEVEPLLASTTQLSGHVGKAIEVEVDKRLRDLVPLLCNKVNEFLRQEEGKIESMVRSAKDLAKDGSLLRADLDKLSAEVVSSREKFDSLARLTPNAVAEVKPGVEELAMQIRTLQSWQDNFTTRPLYKEIVDHITATLPNGVLNQLQVLGSRIEGIEYRLEATEEGEALKRRKMTPAGLRAADGSQ
ncbi:hypothetical protein HIM_00240 [Hirsutella minnesotensis 3608]|nr:hypothetical protein HIM_00240 [Hirsutella minnesotensis 3608]